MMKLSGENSWRLNYFHRKSLSHMLTVSKHASDSYILISVNCNFLGLHIRQILNKHITEFNSWATYSLENNLLKLYYTKNCDQLRRKLWICSHLLKKSLILPAPYSSGRSIKTKIHLNFYFETSLWCLKRFDEGLQGLHKTFGGTTKDCKK